MHPVVVGMVQILRSADGTLDLDVATRLVTERERTIDISLLNISRYAEEHALREHDFDYAGIFPARHGQGRLGFH